MHLHHILEAYHLPPHSTIEPITHGLINATYKVTTPTQAMYVLQKLNTNVFTKPNHIAHNLAAISNHLQHAYTQYPIAPPLALPSGKCMLTLTNGSCYRILPYIPHSTTHHILTTPHQAYEVAAQYGKYAYMLSTMPARALRYTIPQFHNIKLRYTQLRQAIRSGNPQRIAQCHQALQYLHSQAHIVSMYHTAIQGKQLILRPTHHDAKLGNVLFSTTTSKPICVIDLDTTMPGYYISDVGDLMRSCLSASTEDELNLQQVTMRKPYYQAIQDGYLQHMQQVLTPTELALFSYAGRYIIYMQAMRFITDYILNDVYYNTRYTMHNYDRAINQIQLLQAYNQVID